MQDIVGHKKEVRSSVELIKAYEKKHRRIQFAWILKEQRGLWSFFLTYLSCDREEWVKGESNINLELYPVSLIPVPP